MAITERSDDPTLRRLAAVEARLADLTEHRWRADASEPGVAHDRDPVGGELASAEPHPADDALRPDVHPGGSRRNVFKLAAGAAVGGAALALSRPSSPVAAADNGTLRIGDNDTNTQGNSGRTTTRIAYTNSSGPQLGGIGGPYAANVFLVDDVPQGNQPFNPGQSAYPAAVGGYGRESVAHGVYGLSQVDGFGLVGHGSGTDAVGALLRGERANVEIFNEGAPAPGRTDAHRRGEMIADGAGSLWYCVQAGAPGVWREVAGAATAGAFHPVSPFRVFDSRFEANGRLGSNASRSLSMADARDVTTYAVSDADALPSGATAIAANVGAVTTRGTGFLVVNPGGDDRIRAASLNWTDGQNVGNAGIFALDGNRRVQIVVGPDTSLHLTIDITGYYR